MKTTVILSRSIDSDGRETDFEDAFAGLCAGIGGLHVVIVPHLYHLPEHSDIWQTLASITGHLAVATWLFARPAETLLKQHGLNPLAVLDCKTYNTPEECCEAIKNVLSIQAAEHEVAGETSEIRQSLFQRWYPIIETSRCKDCGHCLQFCLFDVFEYDEAQNVVVAKADNCKPGCPACSRVCPESAIMFPLYAKDEAFAGAPGQLVIMDPNATADRAAYIRARQTTPLLQPGQDTPDDIDLLINDLENLTRRKT